MTDMMITSWFTGVKFPLNEVSRHEVTCAPSRGEFMSAAAAYRGDPSGAEKVAIMIAGGRRCMLVIDGYRYKDASRKTVEFMGDFAYDSRSDTEWFPCFGECDFVTLGGKVIVHDKHARD